MTPEVLRKRLADLPGGWPPTSDPALLLRALEDRADAEPGNRALTYAVELAHQLAVVDQDLPPIIAGVRRSVLVRWDSWTTTWIGSSVATGARTMVRVLRPQLARDPVLRRSLRRDARAMGAIDPDLRWVEHPIPALTRVLPGDALGADTTETADPARLVQLLLTGLANLERWERAGIPTPRLASDEWVVVDGNLGVACLTPGHPDANTADELPELAHQLRHWWADSAVTPVDAVIDGFIAFPPVEVEEAGHLVRRALAQHLTHLRHRLLKRHRIARIKTRNQRFSDLLVRLHNATPPPKGTGAVGVDLEGAVRIITSDGTTVSWGSSGRELTPIRTADGTLSPTESRRLLRTRAAAPPNPRLSAQVGGSEGFTEAICRWVASAHHLRTLRLLVERTR